MTSNRTSLQKYEATSGASSSLLSSLNVYIHILCTTHMIDRVRSGYIFFFGRIVTRELITST
jgi:hypothetical protein